MKMSEIPTSQLCHLDLPFMTVERLTYDGRNAPFEETDRREEGVAVQIHLAGVGAHRVRRPGVEQDIGPLPAGSVAIRDMRQVWQSVFPSPFDRIRFRIGLDALRDFTARAGRPEFNGLRCAEDLRDPTLHGLAQALVPALEGAASSRLFVEQVGLATLAHLTQAHGGLHFPSHRRGGLSARQEALATEFLSAHLADDFSMAELAGACGLSRSYFGKAFKATFGKSPSRWLTEYRVARACDELRSDMPIAEVALACGFTDQSHLTRVFASIMHEPPASWRRHHGSARTVSPDPGLRTGPTCASDPATCRPPAKRPA